MAKKITIMFSFFLLAIALLLASDILFVQLTYAKLDSLATEVSYNISRSGGITDAIKDYVKKTIKAEIYCDMEHCSSVKVGDTYCYAIKKSFNPLILKNINNQICVKRSVVIGMFS